MTTSEPAARAGSCYTLAFSYRILRGDPDRFPAARYRKSGGLHYTAPPHARARKPEDAAAAAAGDCPCATLRVIRFSRISKVVQCDGALFTDMPRRSTESSAEHDLSALPAQRQSVSRRRRFIRSGAGHKCGRQMLYSHV